MEDNFELLFQYSVYYVSIACLLIVVILDFYITTVKLRVNDKKALGSWFCGFNSYQSRLSKPVKQKVMKDENVEKLGLKMSNQAYSSSNEKLESNLTDLKFENQTRYCVERSNSQKNQPNLEGTREGTLSSSSQHENQQFHEFKTMNLREMGSDERSQLHRNPSPFASNLSQQSSIILVNQPMNLENSLRPDEVRMKARQVNSVSSIRSAKQRSF